MNSVINRLSVMCLFTGGKDHTRHCFVLCCVSISTSCELQVSCTSFSLQTNYGYPLPQATASGQDTIGAAATTGRHALLPAPIGPVVPYCPLPPLGRGKTAVLVRTDYPHHIALFLVFLKINASG